MKDHKCRRLLRLIVILPVLSTSLLAQQSAAASCTMTALSLNLHGTRDPEAILTALREVSLERADLMLFQEVVRPRPDESGAVDQVAQELGMHVAYAPGFALRDGEEEGLAVLSRYPIVESRVIPLLHNDLLWKSRKRVALAVTVHAPSGELRVYNVHLDTRVNLKTRLDQLRPIAEEASSRTGPVLVGGDLNTNPYRWVAHTLPFLVAPDQGAGVLRYMNKLGYASAFPRKTPTSRWFRMQLDWIFTKNLDSGRVAVQPISFSDHHALCACLSLPSASQITELRN
jgi:endonuclease/exonuclease/phosphatase family metal-dependent hydrolase